MSGGFKSLLSSLRRVVPALAFSALALLGAAAPAQADVADQIRERFTERFGDVRVAHVGPAPYEGLYEIQVGSTLLYTNANVDYIIEGTLIDATTRRDQTRARLDELLAVPIDSLPLELAFKQVHGDGSRQLVVFEDPNCGYCKQLRRTLRDIDNLTLYTFMYPILSADSVRKVQDIWCSSDRAGTWDALMLEGKAPAAAAADCAAPIDQLTALGQSLNVTGTPTLLFANGKRVSGAMPAPALESYLKAAGG